MQGALGEKAPAKPHTERMGSQYVLEKNLFHSSFVNGKQYFFKKESLYFIVSACYRQENLGTGFPTGRNLDVARIKCG